MSRTLTLLLAIIALATSIAIAQEESESKPVDYKERLGFRIGYTATTSGLEKSFGDGIDLALHFVQRIKKPLYIDVSFGALYLGSTHRDDITRMIFGTVFDDVTMRIITVTVAPMLEFPLGERTNIYFSAGLGLYTASLIVEDGIHEFDDSNNYFGVNGGAGLSRRISKNWFLDLNLQFHKFWTPNESELFNPDWIYFYSEGDSDPLFWALTGGVMLRLF